MGMGTPIPAGAISITPRIYIPTEIAYTPRFG